MTTARNTINEAVAALDNLLDNGIEHHALSVIEVLPRCTRHLITHKVTCQSPEYTELLVAQRYDW